MKFCVLIIASLLLMNEESTAGEWKLIQTSDFNGASNANGADMQKVGAPAPEYLSVPGFDVCLGINDRGNSEQYCLPLGQPKSCLDDSWAKLKMLKFDLCVAPNPNGEDMSVSGTFPQAPAEYASCIVGFGGSHGGGWHEWCLPRSKPEACLDETWAKLKKKKFDICPDGLDYQNYVGLLKSFLEERKQEEEELRRSKPQRGRNEQADCIIERRGEWISSDGKSGGGYRDRCLPRSKPKACLDETWAKLKKKKIDICQNGEDFQNNVGLPAPEYLSVPGFKSCLGSQDHGSWTGYCLPLSKPKSCFDESWAKLKKLKFNLCVAPNPNGEDM